MLEIRNLKKSFGKKKVLKGIDLDVEKGDIIGIIGPSGCGKSTFLRCINGLETPTSGSIKYDESELVGKSNLQKERQKIGMVFQQFNLFNNMNVLDNIIFAPTTLGLMTDAAAIKKARAYLKEIGLSDKEKYFPSELSGGQKQRIAIIRTLMNNPELILFDEPSSALDPEMIGEVTELMRKLALQNMTMIVVSHEMRFIKNFCTKVIFMSDGKIIEEGTSTEIFDHPKDAKLKKFLSDIENI